MGPKNSFGFFEAEVYSTKKMTGQADGWNHYINELKKLAKDELVEGLLGGNGDGVQWTQAWPLDKLAGLQKEGIKKIIDAHAKMSRASIVVPYGGKENKFICTNTNEDFTFWQYSGSLGEVQKPCLICSKVNTCSLIGLFASRGANVNNVEQVIKLLKEVNC